MRVTATALHNGEEFFSADLEYAGRTSVFRSAFQLPEVVRNYEVLEVRVEASQQGTTNFGYHRKSFKLIP